MHSRPDFKHQSYWYPVGDGGYREEEVKMIGILNPNDQRMETENDPEYGRCGAGWEKEPGYN